MGKRKRAPWMICLRGWGIAVAADLLGTALLAAAMLQNLVGEESAFSCIAGLSGLSALLGGMSGVRQLPPLPGALAISALFAGTLLVTGLCWTGIAWTEQSGVILLCVGAGGLLAGLFGAGKRPHRKKRKKIS